MDWNIEVIEPAREVLAKLIGFIPNLVGAIAILFLGWIIGKVIIERLVIRLLKSAKLDKAAEKSGIAQFLRKGEIKYSLSELIGILVYWLVILIVIMIAANVLNLEIAANMLEKFTSFLPNVIASIFVLVLGIFFANLLGAIVRSAAINAGISEGRFLGKLTQVIIVVFAVITALYQFGIAQPILASVFTVVIAAVALGLALAFGLGCKDIAAKSMADWLEKFRKK